MNQYIQASIQALVAGGIGALMVAAAGEPWCLLFVGEITLMMWLLGYCHWWLEDRLVCLGGDQVAIGMLVSVEPPADKPLKEKLDTDYSINLLLPHTKMDGDQATAESTAPFGFLIKEQQSTHDAGLVFTGYKPDSAPKTAVLHAEFEGAGIKDLLLGTQIAFGLSVAALIVCLGVPGPIGFIIAVILGILAFLAGLIGAAAGVGDTASPGDVNPALDTLHVNDPATGKGGDLLVVMGRWVYDSGHNDTGGGWNEIHAIKMCERIGTWDGDWPTDVDGLAVKWKDAIGQATSPTTVSDQQLPENHWEVHPHIDGCQPSAPPQPPPR